MVYTLYHLLIDFIASFYDLIKLTIYLYVVQQQKKSCNQNVALTLLL